MTALKNLKTIKAGNVIGILGGGQLGRMLALEAANLGFKVISLCPRRDDESAPAEQVSNEMIYAEYDDLSALDRLIKLCDVVTYEFENIPAETIRYIESSAIINPNSKSIYIAQNRLRERNFLKENNFPTHRFWEINNPSDIENAFKEGNIDKAILKTSSFGYDGKGQVKTSKNDNLKQIWQNSGYSHAIMEEFVDFELEISVILARTSDGEIATFPIGHNVHANGILKTCNIPADISNKTLSNAIKTASAIAEKLSYVGVMGVEFFVLANDNIYVNEIAPRVHNSGHWTMDGCKTSQFEQHIRAISGLPLGSTEMTSDNVVMENLIGADIEKLDQYYNNPHAKIHHYGKTKIKKGRKLGHVNILK